MNSMPWDHHSLLFAFIRGSLGAFFLTSAIGKLRDIYAFLFTVSNYKLLPNKFVRTFAYSLTWLEALIGILLLAGWQTRLAGAASAFLMAVFIFAIGINLARGRRDLECGCFGARHKERIGWNLVLRDLFLLLLSLQLAISGGGALALDNNPAALHKLFLEQTLAGAILPIGLSVAGLYLVYWLWRMLVRLIRILSLEQGK